MSDQDAHQDRRSRFAVRTPMHMPITYRGSTTPGYRLSDTVSQSNRFFVRGLLREGVKAMLNNLPHSNNEEI